MLLCLSFVSIELYEQIIKKKKRPLDEFLTVNLRCCNWIFVVDTLFNRMSLVYISDARYKRSRLRIEFAIFCSCAEYQWYTKSHNIHNTACPTAPVCSYNLFRTLVKIENNFNTIFVAESFILNEYPADNNSSNTNLRKQLCSLVLYRRRSRTK